jgi:nitrite reductase (NO-forming)
MRHDIDGRDAAEGATARAAGGAPARAGSGLTWRRLALIAAVGDLLLLGAVGIVRQDFEALAIAALLAVAAALTRLRRGLVGLLLLAFLMVDVTVFMLPAALSNATAGESLGGVALPATLAAMSLAGLAAAIAAAVQAWRGRTVSSPGPAAQGPAVLAAGAVVALAAVLAVVAVAGPQEDTASQGSQRIALRAAKTAYSTTTLTARPGSVTVSLANRDLFWHTFTIQRLGVNVDVPVGGTRSVSFTAKPGTYTFLCTIPGHASAGMRGTLTIR